MSIKEFISLKKNCSNYFVERTFLEIFIMIILKSNISSLNLNNINIMIYFLGTGKKI